MKRIITYLSVLAALLAVSCNRMEPSDFTGSSDLLTIALRSSEMETRATVQNDPNAVDYENVIDTVDYFFFKNIEGTTLIEHGCKVFEENEERKLYFDTSENGAYKDLRKPFYAYFLVNYKDPQGNGIDHNQAWTLEDLQSLPIVTNFLPQDKDKKEVKVSQFVMDSGNEPIYVKAETQGQAIEKVVRLYHVAAKIVLNITVAESVTGLGDTWKPIMDQTTLRFWNALDSTTVSGTPLERTDADKPFFFNYPDEKLTKNGTSYTSRIFYTYPQQFGTATDGKVTYKNGEPYFKMTFVWEGTKVGATRFYYKILLPNLEKIERNKYYVLTVNINELGGVEDEYVKVSDHYYVVDWQSPQAITQSGVAESRFLDIALPVYSFYGKDEMNVPVISSHPIEIEINSATKEVFKTGVSNTVSQDSGYPKTNANTDFTLKHTLVTDVTRADYDCGIITYEVTVYHADDHSWKKNVTIKQYPPVYVKADESNGYAYVNSYVYYPDFSRWDQQGVYHGGRYKAIVTETYFGNDYRSGAFNNSNEQLGSMSSGVNTGNDNGNQYVVTVSVLPSNYNVKGLTEAVVIGDPRGGKLADNRLGYNAGTNGGRNNNVQNNYDATGLLSQNVIAPAIRIASSWGGTTPILNYNRAEERCASYQENGYPAGRWRIPTVAEIDFLIMLSNYSHIPPLFSPSVEGTRQYDVYWAGGKYGYGGRPYLEDDHTQAFVDLSSATMTDYGLRIGTNNNNYQYFNTYMRCVYDEWYWGEAPMNNQGNNIDKQSEEESYEAKYPMDQRATQWLGYKMD